MHADISAATSAFHSHSLEAFRQDLDALKQEVEVSLGQEDLDHLVKLERLNRFCEAAGRFLIHVSLIH